LTDTLKTQGTPEIQENLGIRVIQGILITTIKTMIHETVIETVIIKTKETIETQGLLKRKIIKTSITIVQKTGIGTVIKIIGIMACLVVMGDIEILIQVCFQKC